MVYKQHQSHLDCHRFLEKQYIAFVLYLYNRNMKNDVYSKCLYWTLCSFVPGFIAQTQRSGNKKGSVSFGNFLHFKQSILEHCIQVPSFLALGKSSSWKEILSSSLTLSFISWTYTYIFANGTLLGKTVWMFMLLFVRWFFHPFTLRGNLHSRSFFACCFCFSILKRRFHA